MSNDTRTPEATALSSVEPHDAGRGSGGVGIMEVDEKDMPVEEARCWFVNGTDRAIDVYVNEDAQPLVTDVQSLSIGSVLTLDGSIDRPYGTYTFEARDRDDPDGPVLATASVPIDEGDSFSAVLHRVGKDDYQFSIYTNDYSPTQDARVVVRHCAYPQSIDWQISQNGETPRVPDDPRSGTLDRGEWQTATDVTEADYLMEVFADDELVTLHRNLEFEVETTYVVHVVGSPEPLYLDPANNYGESADSGIDESKWLLVQAFEVTPGNDVPDTVTQPRPPTSTTDDNENVEFDCEPIDVVETNAYETTVSATDPDGYVTNVTLGDVVPPTDAIGIVDNSLDRTQTLGGTTTATLRIEPDVPEDEYEVTLVANAGTLAERETCTFTVDVNPVEVDRLYDLVDRYQLEGAVDRGLATDLNVLLDSAADHLHAGETMEACALLKEFLDVVGSHKGSGITEPAHDDLQAEGQAVRADLNCG